MKLKFYLRGLGIGIIVTTLILTVAFGVRNSQEALADNSKETSSALNLNKTGTKAANTQQSTENQTEQQTKQQETIQETKSEAATESTVETATEKSPDSSIVIQNETVQDTSDAISVVLNNISTSEGAAQAIQNAGVITDWNDFNNYLIKSGYAVKIHNGTYHLYKGQDYESIAKTITGK